MNNMTVNPAEQEYLKQIYLHTNDLLKDMHTKELAMLVNIKPASVTDMVKKLATKDLVVYNKHHGCRLSEKGVSEALQIIRRNRLWELFLVNKLNMDWKEIHPIASKLQCLTSNYLIDKLSAFLGNPTYDPHGEAIPDKEGNMPETDSMEVYDLRLNQTAKVFGYRDTSSAFLEYIEKLNLLIGTTIKIISLVSYNDSLEILVNGKHNYILSKEISQKIFVR